MSFLMLKLFFNRNSWMVKFLFFLNLALSLLLLGHGAWRSFNFWEKFFFLCFLSQAFFAIAIEKYPWYPKDSPGLGIRIQFQKALVPIVYLWPFFLVSAFFYPQALIFFIFNFLLFPMTLVALILIAFHFKDDDPSPPNFLSGAKH